VEFSLSFEFTEHQECLSARYALVLSGIEEGVFDPVDVDRTAALIVATVDGARTRQITLGDDQPGGRYTRTVAEETLARVIEPILAEDVALPSLDDALAALDDEE